MVLLAVTRFLRSATGATKTAHPNKNLTELKQMCNRLTELIGEQQVAASPSYTSNRSRFYPSAKQSSSSSAAAALTARLQREERFRTTVMCITPAHVAEATPFEIIILLRAAVTFRNCADYEVVSACRPRVFKLLQTMTVHESLTILNLLHNRRRRGSLPSSHKGSIQRGSTEEALMVGLLTRALAQLAHASPGSTVQMLNVLASLPMYIAQREAADRAVRHLETFLPTHESSFRAVDFATALVALCQIYGPEAPSQSMFRTLCENCMVRCGELTPRGIVDILESLVGIGWVHWEVYTAFGSEIGRRAEYVNQTDAGRVLAVFAKTPIEYGDLEATLRTAPALRPQRGRGWRES